MTIEELQRLTNSPNQETKKLATGVLELTAFAESLAARVEALEKELSLHRARLQSLERSKGLQ